MYRVQFKGKQEDIYLDDKRGEPIYRDWLSGNMAERVELRAGFGVESRKIDLMEHVYEREHKVTTMFTRDDLKVLDREIEPFRKERYADERWLASKGLARFEGGILTITDTAGFKAASDMLNALNDLRSKRAYAKKRELEGYDAMLEGKRINAQKPATKPEKGEKTHTKCLTCEKPTKGLRYCDGICLSAAQKAGTYTA